LGGFGPEWGKPRGRLVACACAIERAHGGSEMRGPFEEANKRSLSSCLGRPEGKKPLFALRSSGGAGVVPLLRAQVVVD
jgi:hypothetical protein